jgi:ribose transport system ATP-binding protein
MEDRPHRPGDDARLSTGRPTPVLRLTDIRKSFAGAVALDGVSLDVLPGEVHGLLGKNGSGKSTLVKVLAGFHAPDPGGRMESNGEPVALPLGPGDFRRLGMSFCHQNLGLIPSLTVLENLRLAQMTTARTARIDWSRERRQAREALDRFELDLDIGERVARLSPVERALLAIVRAFEDNRAATAASGKPGLILLDEPTPFLPRAGVDKLFALVRSIAATGSSVIYISHDIDEVLTITDRATVLRDGRKAGELVTREATHGQIVEMIVGRSLARLPAASHADRPAAPGGIVIAGLAGEVLQPSDIALGRGEILGVTGLIGSGYEEIPYLLFGAQPCRAGSLKIEGGAPMPLGAMTPRKALDRGLALLPGDRQHAGAIGSLSIADNMLLPDLDRFFRRGRLDRGAMARQALALCARFEVKPNDPAETLAKLSGGNAQKVLIARLMNLGPRLLLLDEPTQGVDVGTRVQIFAALREAAAQGMSVICASSDAEQLAELCDRVLVFARGAVCDEIAGPSLTKDAVAEACYASMDLSRRPGPADRHVG